MSVVLHSKAHWLTSAESAELVQVTTSNWQEFHSSVLEIERLSFLPTIRASEEELQELAQSPSAIFLIARLVNSSQIAGYLAADRLERFVDVPGVLGDSHFDKQDTLYITSVAVHPRWRRRGLGVALQRDCIAQASELGFARVTAHIRNGATHKLGLRFKVLGSFRDWYQTGESFDYVEIPTAQQ